jgi:hypothetical protein
VDQDSIDRPQPAEPVLRFRFEMTPLDQVLPWGDDDERRVHWFALTDGRYRIEIGDHELLRFSDDPSSPHPYVDYYVVRLWEDVLQWTPAVMEPVPADLVGFISGDDRRWGNRCAEAARLWYGTHTLDLCYLTHPPSIRAWRVRDGDLDTVTVRWDHRAGGRYAAPLSGQVTVPTASFEAAVGRLSDEFFAVMEDRIATLQAQGAPAGVEVDLVRLVAEQGERAVWGQRPGREPDTDWDEVRRGARRLQRFRPSIADLRTRWPGRRP